MCEMDKYNNFKGWLEPFKCSHIRAYYFHEDAPMYCPDCGSYLDGSKVIINDDKAK